MTANKPLQILKIGGSVITDRGKERPHPLRERMGRISTEIADAFSSATFRLIVIHGAGSFGHPLVRRTGIDKGIFKPADRIAMGKTQKLQNVLNGLFVRRLLAAGIPAFPIQASASSVMEGGRLVDMDVAAIAGLLEQGMVPVLYGVPSFDRGRGCSILSGDAIAAHMFVKLSADRILHGTNVRGVFSSDPSADPTAVFLHEVNLHGMRGLPAGISGSTATDVTGGLRRKIEELARVGACGQIFDATTPGLVRRALCGETVGTLVTC